MKRFAGNPHDSNILEESLAQSERVLKRIGGTRTVIAGTDKGFRGKTEIDGTQIMIPKNKKRVRGINKEVIRKRFRVRAAIEPTISHLKEIML